MEYTKYTGYNKYIEQGYVNLMRLNKKVSSRTEYISLLPLILEGQNRAIIGFKPTNKKSEVLC